MSSASTRRSCLAALLAAGLLATACTSSDDESSPAAVAEEQASTATTTAGGDEASPVSTTIAVGESTTSWDPTNDPRLAQPDLAAVAPMMLIQFGQAWADANWKAMAAVADGAVVTTATEWHVVGAEPPIDPDNVGGIVEACEAQTEEKIWACQLEYGGPGPASAFAMTLEETSNGLRVTELAQVEG